VEALFDHTLWHVFVLASALLAGAATLILLLGPVMFETPPLGPGRARLLALGLVGLGISVVLVEWQVVH
jgi:hypothetical protein